MNNNSDAVSESALNRGEVFRADFSDQKIPFNVLPVTKKDDVAIIADKNILNIKGPATLIGKEFLPVIPDNIYQMTIVLRAYETEKGSVEPVLFAGFATYDENKTLQTAAPGTHRYFLSVGKIKTDTEQLEDGWLKISGLITGTANDRFSFREGSRYAKPVMILNQQRPDSLTDIRLVSVVVIKGDFTLD
ncbi:MAG: hypothetical protein AAGA53_07610 [Pseudomonadota bacterium]